MATKKGEGRASTGGRSLMSRAVALLSRREHARTARFGPVRLRHELLRQGVDKDRIHAALSAHQGNELATAQALWQKRFKLPATDPRERARQARFLAARGFSHEVIRRVLDSA